MDSREGSYSCSVSRKQIWEWLILIFVFVTVEVGGDENCPEPTGTLYAYPSGDEFIFDYTFDPLITTNIDLLDRLLTSKKTVVCDWMVRTKAEHTAIITIKDFRLTPSSGSRDADCLKIYDGKTAEDDMLGRLCGGDISAMATRSYKASGRYLLVVYTQGEVTGRRSFKLDYAAEPVPKELVIKIASIVGGSVAAVAIVFLVCKFTHYCRPCRKQCCPDEPQEEGRTQRELRPLAPDAMVPASGGGNADAHGGSASAGQRHQPTGVNGEGDLSLPADEPPPSYDEIFGSAEDRNKLN